MKRFVKLMHTLGAIGMTGALAAIIVLVAVAPEETLADYAAVRQGIHALSRWLLLPSLLLVLTTGLLAMAIHAPFQNAGWVWIKALLSILLFEHTLGAIDVTARDAARLALEAAAGSADPELLARATRSEWASLWAILSLSLAGTVLGVWRPRLRWYGGVVAD